ncbi:unnamed protein product [Ostreobium quekettii]|uniref:Sugar phosphate transporter domain-containing protein n=1 Tax=Ostreobium quekettii TaxID=121088 RepID=A0A8S1IZ86_9CHLO|nr:unnamed protein product [Ostreobium quekettii]
MDDGLLRQVASFISAHSLAGSLKRKQEGDSEDDQEAGKHLLESQSASAPRSIVLQRIACVIASLGWMVVSSGLILLNKHLMVKDGFKYPMALSGMGMVFSAIASFLACRVFKVVTLKAATNAVTTKYFLTHIMPVGFFMAATLHFGNLVYLHLTVAFIQMLKSVTPVMTMFLLFAARLETPTTRMILSVLIVAFGTAMASYGEVQMTAVGMAAAFLSSGSEAIRLVLTQHVLVGHKFHPIEGLMYLAPACIFWLFLGVAFFEYGTMVEANAFALVMRSPLTYLTAAALGFGVNSLGYWVIVLSSSLTLKLLATVKSAALVLFCALFLGETVTLIEALGYALSIVGFLWYNKIKMEDAVQSK